MKKITMVLGSDATAAMFVQRLWLVASLKGTIYDTGTIQGGGHNKVQETDGVRHLLGDAPNPPAHATTVVTSSVQASGSFVWVQPDRDRPCAVSLSFISYQSVLTPHHGNQISAQACATHR